MLLTKIRGARRDLRRLEHWPIFVHRRGMRKIQPDLFEVPAVMNETEAALLPGEGYEVIVTADAKALLSERLRATASWQAAANFPEAMFQSVAANTGYMTLDYMNAWLANLGDVFPSLATVIPLPNQTWEGRPAYAVRLTAGGEQSKPALLMISGVHAAEMVGPDAAIYFLYRLLNAYRSNVAMQLGDLKIEAAAVASLISTLDIYVLPCVNPDGRQFVMDSKDWWRKNRNPKVGANAVGVDINRNYDFIWWSGLGSSTSPRDDTYRGPAPFSEPETRNVGWLLEKSRAQYFMDIHGPAGSLFYTWGDAQDQSTDPGMNFLNAAWDNRRTPPYAEYLNTADDAAIRRMGGVIVGAANSPAGGSYELRQSFGGIYPTSATSDDYAFSRHIADAASAKTFAYTFEYGGADYFPPYDQMLGLVDEVNAAMVGLCAAAMT